GRAHNRGRTLLLRTSRLILGSHEALKCLRRNNDSGKREDALHVGKLLPVVWVLLEHDHEFVRTANQGLGVERQSRSGTEHAFADLVEIGFAGLRGDRSIDLTNGPERYTLGIVGVQNPNDTNLGFFLSEAVLHFSEIHDVYNRTVVSICRNLFKVFRAALD